MDQTIIASQTNTALEKCKTKTLHTTLEKPTLFPCPLCYCILIIKEFKH
jgi:hypothetical protein